MHLCKYILQNNFSSAIIPASILCWSPRLVPFVTSAWQGGALCLTWGPWVFILTATHSLTSQIFKYLLIISMCWPLLDIVLLFSKAFTNPATRRLTLQWEVYLTDIIIQIQHLVIPCLRIHERKIHCYESLRWKDCTGSGVDRAGVWKGNTLLRSNVL